MPQSQRQKGALRKRQKVFCVSGRCMAYCMRLPSVGWSGAVTGGESFYSLAVYGDATGELVESLG